MLWYKNWLETRSRIVFNLTVIALVIALTAIMFFLGKVEPGQNNPPYGVVSIVSLIGFLSLAGNGVRTQAGHLTMVPNPRSTIYTLSLPMSRRRFLLVRSALGLLEGIGLCLIWAIFMWILLQGRATISDLTSPLLATIVCGIWCYFVATFLSTFVNEGLYIWIEWFVLSLYLFLVFMGWMPPFLDILKPAELPIGTIVAIPWLPIAAYLALGGIFLFASIKVLELQDH
jgi:hypothetical protein